jgi:hypothetical protein
MKVTCPRCTETWSGTTAAHCPTCHQTFSTNGIADRAHKGPYNAGPRCVDPASVGLVKNARGYWATPSDGKWLESAAWKQEPAKDSTDTTPTSIGDAS